MNYNPSARATNMYITCVTQPFYS